MNKELTICHLYPDLLDVYADRGNVTVLAKRCAWRGIETQVRRVCAGETTDFADVDIVLIGTGSAQAQKQVSGYGAPLAQSLKTYVENDGVLLAIGAGFQLLGEFYEADGEKIDGFGVLNVQTYAGERQSGHFAVDAVLGGQNVTLVGFEHHSGRTEIGMHQPLGKVRFGFGNDGAGCDGVFYKNTVATYMHGPILPKNPELADFLISAALMKKYGSTELAALDDDIALKAKSVVLERGK